MVFPKHCKECSALFTPRKGNQRYCTPTCADIAAKKQRDAYTKEYRKKPHVKEYYREYAKRPEVAARRKAILQTPEGRAKHKERMRRYYAKHGYPRSKPRFPASFDSLYNQYMGRLITVRGKYYVEELSPETHASICKAINQVLKDKEEGKLDKFIYEDDITLKKTSDNRKMVKK